VGVVQTLLRAGADVTRIDDAGCSALHRACVGGHKDVASLLITADADVNLRDNNAFTPIHYAAQTSALDVVQLLLDKGSQVLD
jgi:ankyrin repeat protein